MIVIDIETTGLDFQKNAIVSIGALNFNKLNNSFYQEAKIDREDEVTQEALKINGFSEEEIKDKNKQTQKQLIENFFKWIEEQEIKILAGHNIGFFDLNFLKKKVEKYNIKIKSRYRSLDLCSVAQTVYFKMNKEFLLDDFKENAMSLFEVLKFCGIPDDRLKLDQGKVVKEGKTHNALEDAKLEAECFSRLLKGQTLLPEYKKFPVPDYLRK